MSNLRNVIANGKTKVITSPLISGSAKKSAILSDDEEAITLASIPSFVHLVFPQPIPGATHMALTFQGGFVGTSTMIYVATKPKEGSSEVNLGLMMARRLHPEDKNRRQIFEITYPPNTLIPKSPPTALPTALTSQESLGPTITTEVPPNPLGNGEPAPRSQGAFLPASHDGRLDVDVPELTEIKFEFEVSSDNQGRVVLYQVEILG